MPEMRSWQALAYFNAGQLDEAEAAYRTTLTLSPEFSGAHFRLGRVLLLKGRLDEALEETRLEKGPVYYNTGLAMVFHTLGNHEASQSALDNLIKNDADRAAYQIAEVYGHRNEPDQAFEWLEQALVIKDSGTTALLGDPAFLTLRADPRWQPFLEKLGLLEFWLAMPPEHGGPIQ